MEEDTKDVEPELKKEKLDNIIFIVVEVIVILFIVAEIIYLLSRLFFG